MTCPVADLLSSLPSVRMLDPAPEALSSLLKTVRTLPVVLPKTTVRQSGHSDQQRELTQ
jgi:hypothetical protein